eukprot:scaffold39169_cov36-Tisochrysis_lutea.AAC.2
MRNRSPSSTGGSRGHAAGDSGAPRSARTPHMTRAPKHSTHQLTYTPTDMRLGLCPCPPRATPSSPALGAFPVPGGFEGL